MKALRDIYKLNVSEPFKQLFTQGMITHKTYKNDTDWVMPRDVAIKEGNLIDIKSQALVTEGPSEKMSKSKKNVVEPDEILDNYGIDATRIFMISDSPPDRELEWTDEGIQSSKNIINRIERYFQNKQTTINDETIKNVEKYVFDIEKNILNFSLNKCVANIYTLFNRLEKSKVYLGENKISKKILICLFPILPRLSSKIYENLFHKEIVTTTWPDVDENLLIESKLDLPIQINGKFSSTIPTKKGYKEDNLLKAVYELDKIKNRLSNKKIKKVINVQDKIINIITD